MVLAAFETRAGPHLAIRRTQPLTPQLYANLGTTPA
jgi:hypothetical protein